MISGGTHSGWSRWTRKGTLTNFFRSFLLRNPANLKLRHCRETSGPDPGSVAPPRRPGGRCRRATDSAGNLGPAQSAQSPERQQGDHSETIP